MVINLVSDIMNWENTLKFHPNLRRLADSDEEEATGQKITVIQLGNEQQMKEMWDASNPDEPIPLRESVSHLRNYPIDTWFGVIREEGDKYKLVAVSGFKVVGEKYAYKGGTRRIASPKYKGDGERARDKAIELKPKMPTIAGYKGAGKRWMTDNKVNLDEAIPEEVIQHFKDTYDNDWDITKWGKILSD